MKNALIADIQRSSIHDGPGLRTTVFFKGCPLRCAWCHNPECISFDKQLLYYPEKCIGCGFCDQGCYAGARVTCGKEYTVEELLAEIRLDKDYYGRDGGVTFSGGEPLAQKEFLHAIVDACRAEGIDCAVETSLIYYDESLFRKLDLVMADLKIWDDEIHKQYTGVSNVKIKEHFKQLNALGIPIIARTPVMMEIDQGIDQISAFLQQLENVKKYELLPYHPLGTTKGQALTLGAELSGNPIFDHSAVFEKPTKEFMKEVNRYAFLR